MIRTARQIYGRSAAARGMGNIDSKASLRRFERHVALTEYGVELFVDPVSEPVPAYINQGRWVITCPACNAGCACTPSITEAACMECGRIHKVIFPGKAQREKAEALLMLRPEPNRNWYPEDTLIAGRIQPKEDLKTLKDENRGRGVS